MLTAAGATVVLINDLSMSPLSGPASISLPLVSLLTAVIFLAGWLCPVVEARRHGPGPAAREPVRCGSWAHAPLVVLGAAPLLLLGLLLSPSRQGLLLAVLGLLLAASYAAWLLAPRASGRDWYGLGTMLVAVLVWGSLARLLDPLSWRGWAGLSRHPMLAVPAIAGGIVLVLAAAG